MAVAEHVDSCSTVKKGAFTFRFGIKVKYAWNPPKRFFRDTLPVPLFTAALGSVNPLTDSEMKE